VPPGTDKFIRPNGHQKTLRKPRSSTLRKAGISARTNVPKVKTCSAQSLAFAKTCQLERGLIHYPSVEPSQHMRRSQTTCNDRPLRRLSSTPNLYVGDQTYSKGANNSPPLRIDCNTFVLPEATINGHQSHPSALLERRTDRQYL
jgi:hypothetical protein